MTQICVIYDETRPGRLAMQMAANLAAEIKAVEPVIVFVAKNQSAAGELQGSLKAIAPADEAAAQSDTGMIADDLLRRRIAEAMKENTGCSNFTVSLFEESAGPSVPQGAILVGQPLHGRVPYNTLHPGTESSTAGRHDGPVLVPFSDGETGLVSARAAFDFIKERRKAKEPVAGQPEVVFYHTTWPDPNALSNEGVDHIVEPAARCMLALEAAAKAEGIEYKTVIETHDDVVQGVVEMAYRLRSGIIVMSRGAEIRKGSYVDRTADYSPVPVLVASSLTQNVAAMADRAQFADFLQSRRSARKQTPSGLPGIISRLTGARIFADPFFVMSVSATMYLLKVVAKIFVGVMLSLPTMLADGIHNVADLVQSFVVIYVMKLARRPSTEHYPFGKKNSEYMLAAFIGLVFFVAVLIFATTCIAGLLHYWYPPADTFMQVHSLWWPHIENNALREGQFPWVFALSVASIAASVLVSRYQIAVGKTSKHKSMVADGQETRGDGLVELVVLAGILIQYFFAAPAWQYLFGLYVCWQIGNTAWELTIDGGRVLNQASIGAEKELTKLAMATAGVVSFTDVNAFQVGHEAVVLGTVETMARSAAIGYIKKALEDSFTKLLLDPDSDFKTARIKLAIRRPDPQRKRIAYALIRRENGEEFVAASLSSATHLAVCDVEHGEIVRTKTELLRKSDIAGHFLDKRVQKVYVLQSDETLNRELEIECTTRIAKAHMPDMVPVPVLRHSRSYTLSPLAID